MASSSLTGDPISLIGPLTPNDRRTQVADGRSAEVEARWNQIADELARMRELKDDWDGQGASAPAVENAEAAVDWLREMRSYPQAIPPSQVAPGVTGEVLLVWQKKNFFLEAEVSKRDQIEWTLAVPGQPNKHWVTNGSVCYFVGSLL
jgi:hypothetical protein